MAPQIAPYGTWKSPITSDAIIQVSSKVDEIIVDPVTSVVYHIEKRPSEARNVLVNTEEGRDVVGKEFNCRTAVQEYGGSAAAAYDGIVAVSNFTDGRVYLVKGRAEPDAVTPESKVLRYACFAFHPKHPHLIVAVQEDHTKPAPPDVVTTLCVINTRSKTVQPLLSGADFYSSPTFSSDGAHIAWTQWKHPDMPWDGSEIHVARVNVDEQGLALTDSRHVAGKWKDISAGFPVWASDDVLLFTSDASGYQNPWVYALSSRTATPVFDKPVTEDFSLPAWTLGDAYGAPLDKKGNFALYTAMRGGRSVFYIVSLKSGTLEEIECPYVSVNQVRFVTEDAVVFYAEKSDGPGGIVLCTIKDYSKPKYASLGKPTTAKSDFSAYLSQPQSLSVDIDNEPIHLIYFPPANPDFAPPTGEKPPCVVHAHGGPTGNATQALSLTVQFYTSRGFAYLEVNYGGSSGYGRKYIDRLNGQWGVIDLRDCALSVQKLASDGLIDSQRIAITGGSSGGFTVLATLCAYPDTFAAGSSLYGISNLQKLDEFTHKFESRYCEKLIGGTYAQIPDVYDGRSPVNNADKIKAPLLILQGSLDAVVPPEQAEDMVKTIRAKGGRVDYVLFEGEGHGWRKAENIKAALEKELAFYEDVFTLKK